MTGTEAKECPRCGHILEAEKGGHFTFKVCPNCQHVFDVE